MSDDQSLDLDVRILRRNLARGFVSRQTVREMLADLPDLEDRAEWIDPAADGEIHRGGRD